MSGDGLAGAPGQLRGAPGRRGTGWAHRLLPTSGSGARGRAAAVPAVVSRSRRAGGFFKVRAYRPLVFAVDAPVPSRGSYARKAAAGRPALTAAAWFSFGWVASVGSVARGMSPCGGGRRCGSGNSCREIHVAADAWSLTVVVPSSTVSSCVFGPLVCPGPRRRKRPRGWLPAFRGRPRDPVGVGAEARRPPGPPCRLEEVSLWLLCVRLPARQTNPATVQNSAVPVPGVS